MQHSHPDPEENTVAAPMAATLNLPCGESALAVLAVAAGYAGYGWQGVVLAVTVVVFTP